MKNIALTIIKVIVFIISFYLTLSANGAMAIIGGFVLLATGVFFGSLKLYQLEKNNQ